jgi:hypothetical protein
VKQESFTLETIRPPKESDLAEWRKRGIRLAESIRSTLPHGTHKSHPPKRARRLRTFIDAAAASPRQDAATWVIDNVRLLHAVEKQTRDLSFGLREMRAVIDRTGAESARVCLVAADYLNHSGQQFSEAELTAFLAGFQDVALLDMDEVWALKPALQLELLDRLDATRPEEWPAIVSSLRKLSETAWKEFFEAVNEVDPVLARDPAGAYSRMDFESRDLYRRTIGELARHGKHDERAVAAMAVRLAARSAEHSDQSPGAVRRAHVGFYLIDRGASELERMAGYRAPLRTRLSRWVLHYPTRFYLAGIEILTLLIVFAMLEGLDTLTPIFSGMLLLILPATQAAIDFMNNLAATIVPTRAMPKLDFSEGIPDDCVTLVAVPALLINEAQIRDLVLDLEIRYLANRDPNLYFALVTDSPDAQTETDRRDNLVELAAALIEALNRRDARSPAFLLHRHRVYNEQEGRWMGWERKRGKLLDLNQVLRGGFDAFPVKVGNIGRLQSVRYVITLDSDTQLPRDSAAKLVGAMAHPLNRAVIDPVTRMVVEGYGILQPRIGISVQSAARSRLAALYSGQTGFDIYTRAVSDVYQDLFGEGIFTGKGIYDVDAVVETLQHRFPENALLSHDLIEGAYARAGLVSDIELIDDYPSHFSAYSRRKHRWVRGDWQILRWLGTKVPDYHGRILPNPITVISQWKIVDNLRRSLLEPSVLLLFLGGWLYLPGPPAFWTAATVALLFLPAWESLLFAIWRIPTSPRAIRAWAGDTLHAFIQGNAIALLTLIFLLHQALLSIDAIVRSVGRVFVTRRKLLEWETAAEAEDASRPKSTVDVYLEWTPYIAVMMAATVGLLHPRALPVAAPVLILWALSRAISNWMNRRPGTTNATLADADRQYLLDGAERICRFFHDWSSDATNWLTPDSVSEDGAAELRLSPTNLAMLLNARIAAVRLGILTIPDFVRHTQATLERVDALPKYRGHLFNWYDIKSLQPLEPRFVSTVDSGNLAASLWTLKQAALAYTADAADHAAPLRAIADTCERIVREMDFRFLYNRKKKVLSVGYSFETGAVLPSCYDLLASEARIAAFVAIAKGDVPQESWFHLGRAHTAAGGERLLLSWTGTMFEYLMPVLWMRHHPGTITERSIRAVVRVQRDYARKKGVPWGISESACRGASGDTYGYAPFGIPAIALKRADTDTLVIAPYATFLAALIEPEAAVKNLRQMEEFGWLGRYGFYEAADYSHGGAEPVRLWMAHHQGMSLLAIVNLLFESPMQQYFHAEPQVLATELLLHERVPASALSDPEPVPMPVLRTAEA